MTLGVPIMDREQEIRVLAHSLWEQEGCPEGRDQDHWYRAEAIWTSEHGSAMQTNGQPSIAGSPAAFEPAASGSVDRDMPPKQGHRRRHHRAA